MENGLDIVSYKIGKEHGGVQPTGEIDITQNGITNVSGYATANVQVPEKQLEEKSVTISSNTTTLIEPSTGKDGMSSVSVTTNIPEPSGKITITENGTDIDVSSYATADVNVPAGADLSDYFGDTLSRGSGSTNQGGASFSKIIKKLPDLTTTGNNLSYCFCGSRITNLPNISGINNVLYFQNFCDHATELVNVDLSSWQFNSGVSNLDYMFSYCDNLEEINLSSLTGMSGDVKLDSMFLKCTKLKKVNLSNLNITSFSWGMWGSIINMFNNCTSLEEVDISKIEMPSQNFSGAFSNVPDNCLILVKDQTAKNWFTTNFSNLTNVQIKSEYLANQGA